MARMGRKLEFAASDRSPGRRISRRRLKCRSVFGALVLLVGTGMTPLLAQTAVEGASSYAVASIKPTAADGPQNIFVQAGGTFRAEALSLQSLISDAYDIGCVHFLDCDLYIVGGPAWVTRQHFVILAKPDHPDKVTGMDALWALARPRIRALLADRFKLKIHHEQKEMQGYALVVAKGGPKLKDPDDSHPNSAGPGMVTSNTTIRKLARTLGRYLRSPVIDHTGIDGTFKIELIYSPTSLYPDASDLTAYPRTRDLPSVFQAVQEQLGLRLEPARLPVDVIVIDSAELPSED
jgi:uncharacterized protein (TIGR03435 family)